MALIENLHDAVDQEYGRLIDEVRIAISESGYTINELSALADVERKTIYRLLNGNDVKAKDTLFRLLFALGGRFEIARPEGSRPFHAVPLAQRSRGSQRSSRRGSSDETGVLSPTGRRPKQETADMSKRIAKTPTRKPAGQRRKSASRKADSFCYMRSARNQRKHTRGTRCDGQNAVIAAPSARLSTARSASIGGRCRPPFGERGCRSRGSRIENDLRYMRSAA